MSSRQKRARSSTATSLTKKGKSREGEIQPALPKGKPGSVGTLEVRRNATSQAEEESDDGIHSVSVVPRRPEETWLAQEAGAFSKGAEPRDYLSMRCVQRVLRDLPSSDACSYIDIVAFDDYYFFGSTDGLPSKLAETVVTVLFVLSDDAIPHAIVVWAKGEDVSVFDSLCMYEAPKNPPTEAIGRFIQLLHERGNDASPKPRVHSTSPPASHADPTYLVHYMKCAAQGSNMCCLEAVNNVVKVVTGKKGNFRRKQIGEAKAFYEWLSKVPQRQRSIVLKKFQEEAPYCFTF